MLTKYSSLIRAAKRVSGSLTVAIFGLVAWASLAPHALADTIPPLVSAVTINPTSVSVGDFVTYTLSASDPSGVSSCTLLDVPVSGGEASTTNTTESTWTQRLVALSAGTYHVQARCTDNSGNTRTGVSSVLTVLAPTPTDTTAPYVSAVAISPLTSRPGDTLTITINPTDADSITSCKLMGLGEMVSFITPSSGSIWSFTIPAPAAGTYHVYATCKDRTGNIGTGVSQDYTVSSVSTDTTAPYVSAVAISPSTSRPGDTLTISINPTDADSITSCKLMGLGEMVSFITPSSGSIWSFTIPAPAAGTYHVYATCKDRTGNIGTGVSQDYTVSSSPAPADTTPPTVSTITPSSVVAGVASSFSASVSDNVGVRECTLFVDGSSVGIMGLSGGTASLTQTLFSVGTHAIYARCVDAAGNSGTGSAQALIVTTPGTSTPTGTGGSSSIPSATPGNLLKMLCPAYAVAADHPCKAVYYYGADGKRHAFPNEHVYFTWYTDFSRVVEVSTSAIAAIPLGRSVVYHPGARLVKFATVNRVYAVGRGRTLRWIPTEAVATSLYGSSWARKVDDITDAFFADYIPGADITASTPYNPAEELFSAGTIEAVL